MNKTVFVASTIREHQYPSWLKGFCVKIDLHRSVANNTYSFFPFPFTFTSVHHQHYIKTSFYSTVWRERGKQTTCVFPCIVYLMGLKTGMQTSLISFIQKFDWLIWDRVTLHHHIAWRKWWDLRVFYHLKDSISFVHLNTTLNNEYRSRVPEDM